MTEGGLSLRLTIFADMYLLIVAFMLLVSAVAQFFLSDMLASPGVWNYAPGWQREIAFWNVALFVAIVLSFRWENAHFKLGMIACITVLTGLLSANHLLSFIVDKEVFWHSVLFLLNAVGTICGAYILSNRKRLINVL